MMTDEDLKREKEYLRSLEEAYDEHEDRIAALERERDNWKENCERVQRHLQYVVAENTQLQAEVAEWKRVARGV